MKLSIVLALSLLAILAPESPAADTIDRSVSPSGQFVIYGSDAAWRGAISALVEQTKRNLFRVLQRRDLWTTAAVINLQARRANLPEIPDVALRFSQTGAGLKLQLDLAISQEMNADAVEREILRVILLEIIYRNQSEIASGEAYIQPPDWLIDGLLALAPNRDRASLVSALSTSEQVTPLEDLLRQRFELLDSVGRSLYRAYSFALVQLLAERPASLGRYIDHLGFSSNDSLADLQKFFPQLAGNDVEQIWRSKIARIRALARFDLPSFSQSEEKLDLLLQRKFPAVNGHDESLSLEEICRKSPTFGQRLGLKKFSDDLMLLGARANPVLRPVVQSYQKLAAQLALGKNHGVAREISDLQNLRTRLAARMAELDDYMNWFEATQLQTQSGLFESQAAAHASRTRPRRRDPFSIYLDAMESQF